MKLRRRGTGESWELRPGTTIGRLESCDVRIDDPSVSRTHARAQQRDGRWVIEDLGSSNGLYLNGQRRKLVEPGDGDLVTFGAVACDVLEEAPAAGAPQPASASAAGAPGAAGASEEEIHEVPVEAGSRVGASERERARLRREAEQGGRGGLGDLSQQPWWVQMLAVAAGLAVMAGVVWGIRTLGAMIP